MGLPCANFRLDEKSLSFAVPSVGGKWDGTVSGHLGQRPIRNAVRQPRMELIVPQPEGSFRRARSTAAPPANEQSHLVFFHVDTL